MASIWSSVLWLRFWVNHDEPFSKNGKKEKDSNMFYCLFISLFACMFFEKESPTLPNLKQLIPVVSMVNLYLNSICCFVIVLLFLLYFFAIKSKKMETHWICWNQTLLDCLISSWSPVLCCPTHLLLISIGVLIIRFFEPAMSLFCPHFHSFTFDIKLNNK